MTDLAPKMELKQIEETTKLPDFKVEKELPEHVDDLAVVLKSADVDKLPEFLSKVISESSYMEEDLKKKKALLIYGRNGDKFKRCTVKVSSFTDFYSTLADAGAFTRTLLGQGVTSCSIYFGNAITSDQISFFLQGVSLTNYKFDRKGDPSAAFKKITSVTVYNSEYDISSERNQNMINTAKYPLFCREILNTRAVEANPQNMLDLCKQIAQSNPKISIETIVGKELQEKGLNLIHCVGRGGVYPSSLVILKYLGNPDKPEDLISFIGKGVCFDAGGLNIKGTGSIENMYMDKGGACTVLAAFKGIVELNLPVNVVCSVAFVENLVGPDAVHPLDIIKSLKGLTVEIGNTDAEGRLILADAMTYTQTHYKPHTMIEMSTLTGAIRAAIGGSLAGLFTNSDKLGKELKKAGKEAGENLWKMPLLAEHKTNMKGNHGDLNNKSKVPAPGASNAAGFLEFFVEKGVQWAHLDIAAVKNSDAEKHVYSVGANGWGVQLLFNFIQNRLPKKEEIKPAEQVEASS